MKHVDEKMTELLSAAQPELSARWQDNYDSSTRRRTHTRELGIWVEMNF